MMKQIKISRWSAEDKVSKENWKDLISAIALAGFEVYADEDYLVFTLSSDDEVTEKED